MRWFLEVWFKNELHSLDLQQLECFSSFGGRGVDTEAAHDAAGTLAVARFEAAIGVTAETDGAATATAVGGHRNYNGKACQPGRCSHGEPRHGSRIARAGVSTNKRARTSTN